MIRNGFADEYRLVVGVHPDQHEQLIERLKESEVTGDERWSQTIEHVKAERGVTPQDEPEWSLLDRKLDLPEEFRNMSHARMMHEYLTGQEHLIEQDQRPEYERITGISLAHHYQLLELLKDAMQTGQGNFTEIRHSIERQREHRPPNDQPSRNGSGSASIL